VHPQLQVPSSTELMESVSILEVEENEKTYTDRLYSGIHSSHEPKYHQGYICHFLLPSLGTSFVMYHGRVDITQRYAMPPRRKERRKEKNHIRT
jgi:hypothetical protein